MSVKGRMTFLQANTNVVIFEENYNGPDRLRVVLIVRLGFNRFISNRFI